MPIIAIEGADKCGKSTLFAQLLGVMVRPKFIQLPSFGKDRMHIASNLALRDLELWEAFYDPKQLYICDRHVIISDAVYSQLYKRPRLRESPLKTEISVLYLDIAVKELKHRHSTCKEDVQDSHQYGLVRVLYDRVLQDFPCHILTHGYTINEAISSIEELVHA